MYRVHQKATLNETPRPSFGLPCLFFFCGTFEMPFQRCFSILRHTCTPADGRGPAVWSGRRALFVQRAVADAIFSYDVQRGIPSTRGPSFLFFPSFVFAAKCTLVPSWSETFASFFRLSIIGYLDGNRSFFRILWYAFSDWNCLFRNSMFLGPRSRSYVF